MKKEVFFYYFEANLPIMTPMHIPVSKAFVFLFSPFLLSVCFCTAQTNLPAALDTLKKAQLITDREKTRVLEKFAALEKFTAKGKLQKGHPEIPSPNYTVQRRLPSSGEIA